MTFVIFMMQKNHARVHHRNDILKEDDLKFVGRTEELDQLNQLFKKKSASLVVIRGRRRIGKSRLIKEFAKGTKSWLFSGLPPTKDTTKQNQIDEFTKQMARNLGMPQLKTNDWGEVFWHLGKLAEKEKIIIVFDEISWMGSNDVEFLGHLKNAWDLYFSNNHELILILCGSVSSWIEKNILSNTGFLGRISIDKVLDELPLANCQEFWMSQKNRVSAYEKLKVLAVTGGVPKYLEEINPTLPAEKNIQNLCFLPEGLLYREYDQIFSDLFSKKAPTYTRIIEVLAKGAMELTAICSELKIKASGVVSGYLYDLILAGFVSEDCTWNLKSKKISTLKRFRLKDNYVRFYLKYIEPNKEKIAKGLFQFKSATGLSGWEIIIGFQFENLVLNNLSSLLKKMKVDINDIVMAGPFFQRKTHRQKGCQIDLLIQTRYQTLYLCEIKFYISAVPNTVVKEVEEKINKLAIPRGCSIRPVLIHVNGITQGILESELFDQIIDFSELFLIT